ncbi:SHOCT domain-containing protein [Microbacterium sp. ET2]|uniref:SHOCT domain-containing protein n=1 Tax=Microbacterium albipurpureum TaxID=3050384 RepID=UPI00259C7250|nr:SHOCT domain-containing protein [Microbacterium sp. ET2 (Ac-2212)]WJL96915.1 SHOCT domain-containing protein [Microbacterium sp. ET2 (Ac-2212)]
MPIRRMGRPGLLGLAARTAVVAGTASAVSGSMQGSRERKAQAQYEQEQYQAAQQQAQLDAAAQAAVAAQMPQAAPAASAPAAPAAGGGDDMIARLQQLAALKQSGVLTDEEFSAAKAKLLS